MDISNHLLRPTADVRKMCLSHIIYHQHISIAIMIMMRVT